MAIGAAGSGYLKIYPFGTSAPNASYLNYRDGKAIANGGTITLNTSGLKHFTVATASHASHVVVDVSGYYVKPMFALIDGPTGSVEFGSRTTGSSRSGNGQYEVDFDRSVVHCAFHASAFAGSRATLVQPSLATDDGVYVEMINTATGADVDTPFYLTVTC